MSDTPDTPTSTSTTASATTTPAPGRRGLLLGGAAVAAAAAGAGVWLRQRQTGPAGAGPALDPAAEAFWAMRFTAPDGQSQLAMAEWRGRPLLLNFWGSWCPPCVKEMPLLDAWAQRVQAQGVRVLGLAVDNPTAVRKFLTEKPVRYAIGLAGFDGTELAKQLGNTAGGLPYTVLFASNGGVLLRKSGELSATDLDDWQKRLAG